VSQPQTPPYTTNDLLLLLGQCTVELAYLRAQMARLEQRLAELEPSPNGQVEAPADMLTAT
jgi:hypothetical protein